MVPVLLAIFFVSIIHALPSNCEICTHAINDYQGNGGGADDLSTPLREGREYGTIGQPTIRNRYPESYAVYAKIAENRSCQKWTFTPQFHWSCTFIQYGGHSNEYYLFLGNGADYGKVYPRDMRFGENNTHPHLNAKWFHTRSCNVFWQSRGGTKPTNVAYWSAAFKGLHTMLGYASDSFDVGTVDQPATDFWNRWVNLSQSIWTAYAESEASYGYRAISGVRGIEVGCLSASRESGGNYCDLSYEQETSTPATYGATYYVSRIFGQPVY